MKVLITWNEDCKLYQYSNDAFINNINTFSPQLFEDISYRELVNDVIEIQYQWIDPIKIRDKIYGKEPKEVTFWVFTQERIVCCFGNSESGIAYAISKLSERTSTVFEKINIFKSWDKLNFLKDGNFGKLTTLHMRRSPTPSNSSEIKKVSIKELADKEIEQYLCSNEVTNLTFVFENINFYLDINSVISFLSTTSEKEIYLVIKNIIKDISKKI